MILSRGAMAEESRTVERWVGVLLVRVSDAWLQESAIVVEMELIRMWSNGNLIQFLFSFPINPHLDEVISKYIADRKEFMVLFQGVDSIIERGRGFFVFSQLFETHLVNVTVQRLVLCCRSYRLVRRQFQITPQPITAMAYLRWGKQISDFIFGDEIAAWGIM